MDSMTFRACPFVWNVEKKLKQEVERKSVILNDCFLFFFLSFINWRLSFHIYDVLFGVLWTGHFCHFKNVHTGCRVHAILPFFGYYFFFFNWRYSPLWALACRTIPLHFSLSITNSLHLLTPSTWRSFSISSLSLGTGESIFGSKAAGCLCLVLWIRISRAISLLPHMHSWQAWGQICPSLLWVLIFFFTLEGFAKWGLCKVVQRIYSPLYWPGCIVMVK